MFVCAGLRVCEHVCLSYETGLANIFTYTHIYIMLTFAQCRFKTDAKATPRENDKLASLGADSLAAIRLVHAIKQRLRKRKFR